jgi:hypothetical protein
VRHQRTLLDELIAAGFQSDPLFPGSFTPLDELTPSTLPTELSDLSSPTDSPRPVTVEPRSEEEVEQLVAQTTAPNTRSRTRALQAQSTPNTALPSQPTASGSNQQPTNTGVPTPHQAPSPTAQIQAPSSPNLAAPAPQNLAPPAAQNPQAPAPAAAQPLVAPVPVAAAAPIAQPPAPPPVALAQPNPAPVPAAAPANPNPAMPLANMPGRSERAAPSFDDSQPEELERYFADLELLLDRHAVADNQDRKQAALKYLKYRTESLWKTAEAWADPTKTYDEFKAEIAKLYPGSSSDRTYTMGDLDMVIGQYARIGIASSTDLGEYYRRFILISRYLISKNRLSTQEQSRTFFRGLQPHLEVKVRQRLQQKLIDHFPDDPYPITDIYEAVSYVLMGTASAMMAQIQNSGPTSAALPVPVPAQIQASPAAADSSSVKLEAMATAITSLTEMFKNVLQTQQAGVAKPRAGIATAGTNAAGSGVCNFCGVPGHFIRECEVVEEAIRFGKCKRSPEGKVVLPTGAHVPRSITGAWLRDRVDEWHRQNPGQMAAQMYCEVTAAPPVSAPSYATAGQAYASCPAPSVAVRSGKTPAGVYALKRPLRPPPEVVITTLPPHRRGRVGPGNNPGGASSNATPAGTSRLPASGEEDTSPPSQDKPPAPAPALAPVPVPQAQEGLTHPYASVPDAINGFRTGPARPVAKEPGPGRHEPGYRNTANIYDPRVAKDVYERAMETPITVTQRELLSLAPEMRTQVADATNRRRVPREQAVQAMVEEVSEDEYDPPENQAHLAPELQVTLEEAEDEDEDNPTPHIRDSARLSHMPATFVAAARAPPPNATIIADPVETYLREHPGDVSAADSKIVVAAESRALRAILPVVDGQDKVEAILDPGCQVVAMSEEICNALALHYDPTIRLHMMSANGGVDQSLGLARNVPFLVGDITLYLQIHVLRAPAYDILLGRPFDVLTQSVVRNYANENQTVTIKDPNTGRKATVPTIARGSFRFADRRPKKSPEQQQDF